MIGYLVATAAGMCAFVLADREGATQFRSASGHRSGLAAAGVSVAAAGVGLTGSLVVALLLPAVFMAVAVALRSERNRRRKIAQLRQVPVVVELLASRLGSGSTVQAAIDDLDPSQLAAVGLTGVAARVRAGDRLADVLGPQAGLLGAALLAVEVSGHPGGDALERLADRLRAASSDGDAAQSQSGQQLASAAVMSLLPPLVSLLYASSDARAAHFYLHTPWGAVVIVASLSLSAFGWWWMRYITRPGQV